ncbi:MAG: hypothetical protein MPJ24_07970 [Pirellulaceae bacterium]|nr:hypothetical protein [Pirellulaceae bacterium]
MPKLSSKIGSAAILYFLLFALLPQSGCQESSPPLPPGAIDKTATNPFTEETTDQEIGKRAEEIQEIMKVAKTAYEQKNYPLLKEQVDKLRPIRNKLGGWKETLDQYDSTLDKADF